MQAQIVRRLWVMVALMSQLLAQTTTSFGQSWSGQIAYEAVRKIDPSSMRIVINGEQVKPGDPNFPTDIPDTRTFGLNVQVAGSYAKETREEQGAAITIQAGNGPPRTRNIERPFKEQTFVDLNGAKTITVLTVGKDSEAKVYRADKPIQRVEGWQMTDQTKKIAGYACRKATVLYKKETYSVWVTTELPITYSPIPDLTPAAGTVLLIEGSREQFRATKVNAQPIAAVSLPVDATLVSPNELNDIKDKAFADFNQQMMMMGPRN